MLTESALEPDLIDVVEALTTHYEQETRYNIDDETLPVLGDTVLSILGVSRNHFRDDFPSERTLQETVFTTEEKQVTVSPMERDILTLLQIHKGTPLLSAQLRHMGIQGSAQEVRHALHSLLKKLNTDAHSIILVSGQTKGTRYELNPISDVNEEFLNHSFVPTEADVDEEMKDNRKNKNEKYEQRVQLIDQIISRYGTHPLVTRAIKQIRKQNYVPKVTNNPISDYLNHIGAYQLLTKEDERILFTDIDRAVAFLEENGQASTPTEELLLIHAATSHQVLFYSNLRLAFNRAKSYMRGTMDPMEIVQESNKGLLDAIARFDANMSYKFSTYAVPWTRQAIERMLANNKSLVRLPVHIHEKLAVARRELSVRENELGRKLTVEEEQEITGMDHNEYDRLARLARDGMVRLDAPFGEDEHPYHAIVEGTENVENKVLLMDDARTLSSLLQQANITDLQRVVLALRSGIDPSILPGLKVQLSDEVSVTYAELAASIPTSKGMLLEEVADVIGIDRLSVRKLESRAMKTLRELAS